MRSSCFRSVLLRISLPVLALGASVGLSAATDPATLMNDPTIKAALAAAERNEPQTIEQQVKINEIPAPPFMEEVRGKELARLFKELGLKDVHTDKVGNVIGTRPGANPTPNVVVAAHLDTVFPEGTDVKVKREGNILKGPGISDDVRGLAALLSVVRALDEGKVKTPGTITFVADVGEEGMGDIRGIKQLFNETLKGKIDYFISIDGTEPHVVTNAAVGSYRYRTTFKGLGGHSYGAFGLANPIHAMGRAIAKIGEIKVPTTPKTTFNVGRVGGGTSVNSIAFEAWLEMDMRSEDVKALDAVREQFVAAVDAAVKEENDRWHGRGPITVDNALVGVRPAGKTADDSAIVKITDSAITSLGLKPRHVASSGDSNWPMSLGIPAVTLGGGGIGTGSHALNEMFETTESWKGPQMLILTIVSLTHQEK
jgi:acetylornithine deacetylase/succinyl-diaminopimelate desuccinylase-like protein